MTNKNSLGPVIEKLESLFEAINNRFYAGELVKPVITVSPTMKGAMGWCTGWKAWLNGNNGYYEINICAEYLSRPFDEIVEIMMHEMVHLYDLQQGVKDCSRGGTYHNRRFKKTAETHGLTVKKDEKYGWCITELNSEGMIFAQSLEASQFELHRMMLPKKIKAPTANRTPSIKYVCPVCGAYVKAKNHMNIACLDCAVTMLEAA